MPVLLRARVLPPALLAGVVAGGVLVPLPAATAGVVAGGVLVPLPAATAGTVAAPVTGAAPAVASAAPARTATRLSITVTRGRRATLSGVLTTSGGRPVAGRTVTAWWRAADIGTWRSWSLRTDAQGRVSRRVGDRPNLQYTLRFAGDARYGRAASAALVPAPSATGPSPALVRGLARARTAARRAGIGLVVNSGYRTWARQQAWYEAAVRRYGSPRAARLWVLPPGESTHVRGLAIDVGPPATAAWLARNGARFGFCRTYANEAWHFEYRPRWVRAPGGRCPAPVAVPGDPDPLSPRPRVPVR